MRRSFRTILLLQTCAVVISLAGCAQSVEEGTSTTTTVAQPSNSAEVNNTTTTDSTSVSETGDEVDQEEKVDPIIDTLSDAITVKFTSYELSDQWQSKKKAVITMKKDQVLVEGDGVVVKDSVITITQKGTYELTGELDNGQVIVTVPDNEKVRLVLNNAAIHCDDSCAIYVQSSDKTVLYLPEGTSNALTDGASYTRTYAGQSQPNACIYSNTDLVISGPGSLSIDGAYNNGIGCKEDFKLIDSKLTVTALKNAIRGKDSVSISGATLVATAGNDCIRSDQEGNPAKGFIYIKSGEITLTAGDDAMQCFSAFYAKLPAKIIATSKGQNVHCDNLVEIDGDCLPGGLN